MEKLQVALGTQPLHEWSTMAFQLWHSAEGPTA